MTYTIEHPAVSLCIIPARGGSQRLPGKNIKAFFGKPILAYSIETAKAAGCRVIVSTDDKDIAAVARKFGAVAHERSADMARDEVGTQEVARHVLESVGQVPDMVIVMYPCAPLVTADDLKTATSMAKYWKAYAVSVGIEPLRDAGAFYIGPAEYFRDGVPLWKGARTIAYWLPEERVCDVNTSSDWFLLEQKYEWLQRHERTD